MKKSSRIILVILSLVLITSYFFPLWMIDLEAPQYPEGLGMKIWVNKITGDLNTINGLNHYIGMKTIEPDSIPELTIMPYIIGFLILTGLLTALLNNKKVLMAWVILILGAGIAGGYDFYQWEYDYGHDLDPTAAIKVPGMSYQPPLIGSKKLLNFNASSYPDIGGYAIIFVTLVSIGLVFYEIKFNKNKKQNTSST